MATFLPILPQDDVDRAAQVSSTYEYVCGTIGRALRIQTARVFVTTSARYGQEDLRQELIPFCQLIQQAYSPQQKLSSEAQRRLQQELFEIQRRPEAWGLVLPFLSHSDPNVQFFGAHTIQVKIARDW